MADEKMELEEEYRRIVIVLYEMYLSSKTGVFDNTETANHARTLCHKFLDHIGSIVFLRSGPQKQGIDDFPRLASINALVRVAYEAMLVFAHVFYSFENQNEFELRYLLWQRAGYMNRRRASIKTLSKEAELKLNEEQSIIIDLENRIKANPLWNRIEEDKNRRKRYERGEWNIDGLKKIASEIGLSEEYYNSMYIYGCSYTHTDFLSIMQVGHLKSDNDRLKLTISSLHFALMSMSLFIEMYSRCFPEAKSKDLNVFDKIHFWVKVGRTFNSEVITRFEEQND